MAAAGLRAADRQLTERVNEMAAPITSIQRTVRTELEIQQQQLELLQQQLAEQQQALQKIIEITAELNDIGALDALQSMLQTKEKITGIALEQISKEPVTNLLNNVMAAAGVLTAVEPESAVRAAESVKQGLSEAQKSIEDQQKTTVFQLMKSLNDPDINRAITFGMSFLKGMGRSLNEPAE